MYNLRFSGIVDRPSDCNREIKTFYLLFPKIDVHDGYVIGMI